MAPNSKNYDGYQVTSTKSTWKPNFLQLGGFLYFCGHSKPKWSPYDAACLTPCKYPFPLKSFHF